MSEEQLIKTPGVFGENGNFLLERELGRGGMGGVYMGRDKMLDRPVAVKVMLKEYGSDAEFVEKFKKEAQAAAKLIHPNIAQVYSYGISDGMPYIAMELVPGGSLDKLMATHGAAIDVPRVMKICEQVAQALRCAADQGLVHGDVKPENVLLDANGNAKLVDFGLAAMQKDTNEIWGTPYYIAPEKVKKLPVDYRADMYSLGGTIYHALTGVAPFEGDDALEVVKKRFQGPPKKPSEVRPGLSPQIDFLVMKMLEDDPQKRYPSFEALLDDFKKVMTTGLVSTQPIPSAEGESPASAAQKGKRLMIKSKRKLTVRRQTETSAGEGESGGGSDEVAELDEANASGGGVPSRLKLHGVGDEEFADDEGSSHIGLVLGGIVGAVVLIAGALFWYWTSFYEGEAAAAQAQVESGFKAVQKNYAVLEKEVASFETQVDKIVGDATNECQRINDQVAKKMAEIYPQSYVDLLKPPKTAALVKAEQELMKELVSAADPAAGAAAAAPTATAAQPTAPAAKPKLSDAGFRPPTGEELDPMSPEHQDYLKEKAEWEAKHKANAGAAQEPAAAPSDAASGEGEAEEVLDKPTCIEKVNKIWEATYDCVAASIIVHSRLKQIKADIAAKSLMPPPDARNEASVRAFNDAQVAINNAFKDLRSSDEVANNILKIPGLLKGRGKKAYEECVKQVKRIKEKRQQKAAEDLAKKKWIDEQKQRDEALAARREEEVAKAKQIYDDLVSDGQVRTLDWNACSNKLLQAKAKMGSGEGKAEADFQILKIKMMADVQSIIMRNLKGWEFKKGEGKESKAKPIKGWTVSDVDERRIALKSKRGEKREITWMKFYNEYPTNFNDLINTFIRKGDKNGKPTLNKLDRVNAMVGVALTLSIICTENPTAEVAADRVAKESFKTFPEMGEIIQRIFPDKDFSDVEAAAASENL